MNRTRILALSTLIILMLTSCLPGNATPATEIPPTATLPPPGVRRTQTPDVQVVAEAFLQQWQAESYVNMYELLTPISKDAIDVNTFTELYQDVAVNLTLLELEYQILSSMTNPESAQVAYRVIFNTSLLGAISRDMVMNLSLVNGEWKIQWEDGLIMPELSGGNRLAIDIQSPARGEIYDNEGGIMAGYSEAYALGIQPGKIERGRTLVAELSRLTNLDPDYIRSLYEYAADDWYVPVGDAAAQAVEERMEILSGLPGLIMNSYTSRYYFDRIAPHVVGYVQPIPAEEAEQYRREGYRANELVGMAGMELWSEDELLGDRGADLYVVDQQGQTVTRLAQKDALPAQSINTTIDRNLQERAQEALAGFRGAIVVMERDTGRVLAMVSSPDFNPNLFAAGNYNRNQLLGPMLSDGENRLLNRATQGGYPLGSVFKIITMAAALESGYYSEDSAYNCGHEFTELPGWTGYDWTYEKEVAPSGLLTLSEGLMRSCNPYFWHIGLDLYRRDVPDLVAETAIGFGLGKKTGIEIDEDPGNIPFPENEGDAVQLAIGQGSSLVTPVQVAAFIAALGNGGTIYRPQLIEEVVDANGNVVSSFQPEATGQLPIKPETLTIVREAMRSVVENPRGTAHSKFLGTTIPIYGKTGTAQNPFGDAHAWFAGYTDTQNNPKPNIAIAVIAENAGEGSEVGAPIFRRIIEIYYEGTPRTLYPWETTFGVTKTPTSEPTNTLVPTLTETPDPNATPEPES